MSAPSRPAPRRFTRAEYHTLGATGVFAGQRVELLDGIVVHKPVISGPHAYAVDRLARLLIVGAGERARIRIQQPLEASDQSEPEPDLAVCPPGDYLHDHPSEAWLVAEVAMSSLDTDRTTMAQLYAQMEVPEYWVVNLVDRVVEVFTGPSGGGYQHTAVVAPGSALAVGALPELVVPVSSVLPPAP